jgi:hypothetical protein
MHHGGALSSQLLSRSTRPLCPISPAPARASPCPCCAPSCTCAARPRCAPTSAAPYAPFLPAPPPRYSRPPAPDPAAAAYVSWCAVGAGGCCLGRAPRSCPCWCCPRWLAGRPAGLQVQVLLQGARGHLACWGAAAGPQWHCLGPLLPLLLPRMEGVGRWRGMCPARRSGPTQLPRSCCRGQRGSGSDEPRAAEPTHLLSPQAARPAHPRRLRWCGARALAWPLLHAGNKPGAAGGEGGWGCVGGGWVRAGRA